MPRLLSRLLLILLFPSLLLTACGSSPQAEQLSTTTTPATIASGKTVQLGFSAWPGWFPWQVAEEAGLFEKNGLKVKLTWFTGYADSINALAAGKLDANSQTLNDTLSSVSGGADLAVVLVNDNSIGNDQIIVRDGIKSLKELKGKKVAAELGTVDHFLLLLAMQKEGMTQKDIDFQPLETGAAAAAFVAGKVDAVGVFAPFTTGALKRPKSRILTTSRNFPGAIPDHLVVSRKFLKEHPEEVQKLVNTWYDTLDYIQANPEKSLLIMAKRAGVTREEYKDYETGTRIFNLKENLTAFASGNDMSHLDYATRTTSDFLVKSGLVKTAPKTEKLFDPSFVQAYAQKKGSDK
jgi:NitT/TauT family transport system substrate-binding protein